jgi:hypothetical protein
MFIFTLIKQFVMRTFLFILISILSYKFSGDIVLAQSWQQCASLPEGMSALTLRIGERIFVLNRTDNTTSGGKLFEYDRVKNSYTEKRRLNVSRFSFGAIVFHDKIYVFGGIINKQKGTRTHIVEEYNPLLDKWVTRNPMPTPRSNMEICIYNDKIYVLGGFTRDVDVDTNVLEVYNPAFDIWESKMPSPKKSSYGPIKFINNKLYQPWGNGFYIYSPESDQWTKSFKSPHQEGIIRSVAINEEIYTFSKNFFVHDGVIYFDKYNTSTDSWTTLPNPDFNKMDFYFGVAGLRLFVLGGWSSDPQVSEKTCATYDVATSRWHNLPDMNFSRVEMSVEQMGDSLIVFGGMDGYKYVENYHIDDNVVDYRSNVEWMKISDIYPK